MTLVYIDQWVLIRRDHTHFGEQETREYFYFPEQRKERLISLLGQWLSSGKSLSSNLLARIELINKHGYSPLSLDVDHTNRLREGRGICKAMVGPRRRCEWSDKDMWSCEFSISFGYPPRKVGETPFEQFFIDFGAHTLAGLLWFSRKTSIAPNSLWKDNAELFVDCKEWGSNTSDMEPELREVCIECARAMAGLIEYFENRKQLPAPPHVQPKQAASQRSCAQNMLRVLGVKKRFRRACDFEIWTDAYRWAA
jgi:hypothetical protein